MQQGTLHTSVTLSGKGLHTGMQVQATLRPAPVDSGICFARVDLAGQPCYRALASLVSETRRGTVLTQGAWRVSTIEHLMSALYALGVTNCLVELNGPEVPILDGSARCWVDAVRQAGVDEQDAPAKEWVVTKPVTITDKGSSITFLPLQNGEQTSIEVNVDYHSPVLLPQTARLTNWDMYADEISRARTFCFLREIKPLLRLNLIKGGDLSNALVIYDKRMWQCSLNRLADKLSQPRRDAKVLGYLSELLYDNEPARHKLLDIIGDLALTGVRLRARIVASKPGHGFNTMVAKKIINIINI